MTRSLRLVAVVLLLVPLLGIGVAHAQPYQVHFRGRIALADWSTCPEWTVGAVCHDTEVIASDSVLREGKERDAGPYLIVRRYVYEVVDLGEGGLSPRPIVESFGGTDAAAVTIGPRLTLGYTAASIPMNTCEYSPDLEQTCYPETVEAAVTWTGTGEPLPLRERSVDVNRCLLAAVYTLGQERGATAAATIDGIAPPGDLQSATLIRVRQGEFRLERCA